MVSAYDSGSLKYESVKFDEIKVHAYGDTAVVTGRSTIKGKDNGKDISGQTRYTRVYVKRQGGVAVSCHTTYPHPRVMSSVPQPLDTFPIFPASVLKKPALIPARSCTPLYNP